jgi:hypothetical protein
MIKNIFVSDEDKKISNTIAGAALVGTLFVLYFLMKPTDVYGYILNIAIALIVGGAVYIIVELIRKKRLK